MNPNQILVVWLINIVEESCNFGFGYAEKSFETFFVTTHAESNKVTKSAKFMRISGELQFSSTFSSFLSEVFVEKPQRLFTLVFA